MPSSKRKILFLSDAVSCRTGLGRITRDLALRVHCQLGDVYEVASVGYGGPGSVSIPFKEYHLHDINNWLVPELPAIWTDFVGEEEGILFSIWDASRLYWLGMPQTCRMPHLRKWVETARVRKWLYGALDAEGPRGGLSHSIAQTYKGFDRVLDYSAFSSKVTGNPEHLPHGIDTAVFCPRDRKEARIGFAQGGFTGLTEDTLLVGILATNQARKNWQLGMETVRILLDRGRNVRLWGHTDALERYWSLSNLIADYSLQGRVALTTNRFPDEQLSWMYSSCDVTLGIGAEGFGYPVAESLACGVPCIAGSYGGQAEFVPPHMQVKPTGFYYEGAFCSKRPVHDAAKWAERVITVGRARDRSLLPPEVDWHGPTLWPRWRQWFLDGLEQPGLPSAADLDAAAAEGGIQ
jgi:glycosyltransferase involved in cell wall biosynthesis